MKKSAVILLTLLLCLATSCDKSANLALPTATEFPEPIKDAFTPEELGQEVALRR